MAGLLGIFSRSKDQSSTHSIYSSKKEETSRGNKPFKCFILQTGKTLNSHKDFMHRLKRQVPDLQVVQTEAECDIILVFCPIIRTLSLDIKAALEELNGISGTKSAVLVVLHHTFDPVYVVPDSSRAVSRGNTLTLDCLFHEDQGLLQCQKNEESLTRIVTHIKPQNPQERFVQDRVATGQSRRVTSSHSVKNTEQMKRKHQGQAEKDTLKYFILLTGRTLNIDMVLVSHLKHKIPQLQQVSTVDECDFILAFCPIVSRAGTDIEAAQKKLNNESAVKPAVLVALHCTFNLECVVPDSSRAVHRENTITVDCLFYDQALLQCRKNEESLSRIINYIKPKICPILSTEEERETEKYQPPAKKKYKYFICQLENTPTSIKDFMDNLKEMSDFQEVKTEKECDFILTFCPVVSQDGTDFQKALKELEKNKPVVHMKPQDSCLPECVEPGLSRSVNSDKIYSENHESVQSSGNDEADTEKYEPMDTQESDPSKCNVKQENIIKGTEPSKNKLEPMEMKLQEKDRQIEEMRMELKKQNIELAEKNEELKKKKEALYSVHKLLNEGLHVLEMSKN